MLTARPSALSPAPQPPQHTTAAPGTPTAEENWYAWVVPQHGYVSASGERVAAEFTGNLGQR